MKLFNSNVILLVSICVTFQGTSCIDKWRYGRDIGYDQSDRYKMIKTLFELLYDNSPPRGESFPRINGPKPDENVCIVGAGPAGIDMALRLKDKGYSNIKIFEKTARVGGKSYDTKINGVYRPQGTTFLTADYIDNMIKLAKRYNVGELKAIPMSEVRAKLGIV